MIGSLFKHLLNCFYHIIKRCYHIVYDQMSVEPRVAMLQDLRIQSFDAIRFASYRTASKLRYIQKSTNRE